MKRTLSCLFVLTMLCLMALPAALAGAEEPVTIRFSWWGGDSRHEATLKAIDRYMELNPHVTIEAEYSGFSGYYQKLVTQLASGNAPDMFQSDQGWTAELFARGDVFADLNEFSDILDSGTFSDALLHDYCVKEGKLVVLPLGYNGTVFLYNTALMAEYLDANGELNLTWERLIEIGRDMHEKDDSLYMTTSITDGYVRYILKPILEQITNAISVQDDFTLGFTVEQMAEAFEIFQSIFKSGAAQPYAESVIYDSMQNNPYWIEGRMGGIFLFFSNIPNEIRDLPYGYDVTALPMMDGALTTGQESAPSLMVAINKTSTAQEACAGFINWMLNDPEAAQLLKTERGVPASKTALEALTANELMSPLMAKAVRISDETVGFKNGQYEMDASIHAIFVEKMEEVIYEVSTPHAAAQALYDELTARLEEMKGE